MAKGSQWERDVCDFLTTWIQGSKFPRIFWRGMGSGGMFTRTEAVGETFAGDVYAVREEGRWFCDLFTVECKTGYKQASFDKHLKHNKSDPIFDFWRQVTGDAKKSKKYPMLIYKKTGMQSPWVGINIDTFKKILFLMNNERCVTIKWGHDEKLESLYFFNMNEFFTNVSPEKMKLYIKSINI